MRNIPHERIGEYMKTTLTVLSEKSEMLPTKEVFRIVRECIHPSEFEDARYEKTGYVRWESYLHFYSINMSKAGWIQKKRGYWAVTSEGRKVAALPAEEVFGKARQAFKEWKKLHPKEQQDEDAEPQVSDATVVTLEQEESRATTGIIEYINNLNPYEFQDLVAAVLEGMGFYIPLVAPRGKDGGIDIIAYKDPLGAVPPRIKVQVKHRQEKCGPQTVRELMGMIRKEGEMGLIVSSGGFTPDALVEIQKSPVHISSIDLGTLIDLWEEHYDKLDEERKKLLPLRRIAFLDDGE